MTVKRSIVATLALLLAWLPGIAVAQDNGGLLLKNVQILHVDGEGARLERDMAIFVEGGTITQILPTRQADGIAAARVVEGEGRVVMAGLVDMHVHVWDQAALGAYLAAGVTTIRNASGMPFHLRLADQIESGDVVGPRLITTGPILNSPGPNAQINHTMVTTAEEARGAVQEQYGAGYRRLKVYSNLTREAYEVVHAEARRLGMTIMGHTPEGVRRPGVPREAPFDIAFEEILDDGFVSIEHVESIVWHGLGERYEEGAARALARRIADAGVPVDPTLLAFYNLLRVAETKGDYLSRPGTEMLNPLLVAQSQPEYERWSAEDVPKNRAAFAFYQRMVRLLADEDVLLLAGSDSGIFTNVPGVSLLEELELLRDAGLEPAAVLRAATINPAVALAEQGRAGRVAEGFRADLIMLDGDPSQDLSALRTLSAVITGGRLLERDELDHLKAQAAQHDPQRTQQNLIEALTAQGVDPALLAQ